MSSESLEKQSQLISALREGVAVVQMIFFKEVRATVGEKFSDRDPGFISMLAGAVINEVFGTVNPEQRFADFRKGNRGTIEQELISLKTDHAGLLPALTDALRIQVLCENQEGSDSTDILKQADTLGILQEDRTVPMPSTFMTLVRGLGEQHNLIIAPVQITPEQDKQLVH